jgi:hypothetical protein
VSSSTESVVRLGFGMGMLNLASAKCQLSHKEQNFVVAGSDPPLPPPLHLHSDLPRRILGLRPPEGIEERHLERAGDEQGRDWASQHLWESGPDEAAIRLGHLDDAQRISTSEDNSLAGLSSMIRGL